MFRISNSVESKTRTYHGQGGTRAPGGSPGHNVIIANVIITIIIIVIMSRIIISILYCVITSIIDIISTNIIIIPDVHLAARDAV